MIEQLENLPRITFIDGVTLDSINAEMERAYEEKYEEVTGKPLSLARADPETLKIYAGAVYLFQGMNLLEIAGLNNTLAGAEGAYLDQLAALKGVARLPAQRATVLVRFTLSAPLVSAATIPLGTKVSAGTGLYFATSEQVEIPAGEMSADVLCICETAGTSGSGIPVGKITTLVDRLPYVGRVENITPSQGGSDIESDDSLRERTFLAPSAFSTAGPYDAYEYHTRSYNQRITSVSISSPKACDVEIRVLLDGGELPTEAFLEGLLEHLSDRKLRPLTDRVKVFAPSPNTYDVDVTYWIGRSSASRAATIQSQVEGAITAFVTWQGSEIGRDLNPSELIHRMVEAGAKRVEVRSPVFTVQPSNAVAQLGTKRVQYGGVEDD